MSQLHKIILSQKPTAKLTIALKHANSYNNRWNEL